MVERRRHGKDPVYVALLVTDATRWLVWWLMKALVGWGAVVSGDLHLSNEWTADTPPPRSLRRDLLLRREVRHGVALIEAHLAMSSPPRHAILPDDEGSHRARSDGGSG